MAAMLHSMTRPGLLSLVGLVLLLAAPLRATGQVSFAPGDVFVSIEHGPIQWWLADGTPRALLTSTVIGAGEGMAFDLSGNLYVARWCQDAFCMTGNTVEKFSVLGHSMGAVGGGYNCNPHALVFDAAGVAYVGQAGCRRTLLKFVPGQVDPIEFHAETDVQGIFWVDLAPDGCTLFYTSYGPNVKRFDVCAGVQLPNFNVAPVPGGVAHDLRVLPDGGVLVSTGEVISRLDPTGTVVQTYRGPVESTYWVGLDLVGDGTFWAVNYFSSNVRRFDLASGDLLSSFNTGTPPNSAVAVRVKR
jgi:outer membrane protein assembly factor BamB